MNKKIIKIAKKARLALEEFAHSQFSQFEDYHKSKDLNQACAVGAIFLQTILKEQYNIVVNLRIARKNEFAHCFCEKDNVVYDITASQFGYENVHVDTLYEFEEKIQLPKSKIIKNWKWLMNDWPLEQLPRVEILQQLKKIYEDYK